MTRRLTDLPLKCPHCDRRLRVPFYRCATIFFQRKCQGCKTQWQIKVVPVRIKVGYAHLATFRSIA